MSLRPVGVGIPWSQDMSRLLRLGSVASAQGDSRSGKTGWGSLVCPSRGWALWLAAAGHAFAMRPSEAVNALAGPVTWSFDAADLKRWLSGGLLVDGPAALVLVERGFGPLIGLLSGRLVTQDEVLYSMERSRDARFGLRPDARMSVNAKPYSAALLQADLAEGALVASDLLDPRDRVVGHGLVLFENHLGGRVAVVPWSADGEVHMNAQRAAQLTRVLAFLDPSNRHGWVEGGAWLVPQFLTDGERWRGVVWNASPDEIDEVTVHYPADMPPPRAAVQVGSRGERTPADIRGESVRFRRPLHQWECVVLL